tara:strand:+ start:1273 stop:1527 length:255 start_codon:yes stop_codon:yes gene_type:complete
MVDPEDIDEVQQTPTGSESEKPWTPATYDEIAKEWGVSREAVRRTHERAIKKLRRALRLDPIVRDWLRENGFNPEEITDADGNY